MPVPFLVRYRGKSYHRLVETLLHRISDKNIQLIKPHLKGKKILDIGVGAGLTYHLLQNLGYDMSGVDVVNLSTYPEIQPTIYDGQHIPFAANRFDTSLLIHVLHHCHDQTAVLREATRTSRRIIIIEDTYCNWIERIITNLNDCIGNFEFYRHPYHTILEWQQIFTKNKLKLIKQIDFYRRPWYFPLPVHYCLFVLE